MSNYLRYTECGSYLCSVNKQICSSTLQQVTLYFPDDENTYRSIFLTLFITCKRNELNKHVTKNVNCIEALGLVVQN